MVATSVDTTGQGLSGRAITLFPFTLGLGVLVVAFVIAFLPSIQWINEEWGGSSGVLSHGYLVAAISMYLFIRAIPEAATLTNKPVWWALPILLLLSIIWLLGYAATVVAAQTIVLPVILLSAIAFAFGYSVLRQFAFPVLFIYFAIPAIEHLQFIFQAITVVAVSILVRMADIPALIEGNFVVISQGTFEITGGCSGLNYIVAGLSLAVFYGRLFYTTIRQNLQLVVVALAAAMFGNWIRVFTVIVVGNRTNMQSEIVHDHLTVGWILFAVVMIPVYFIARRIEIRNNEVRDAGKPRLSNKVAQENVNWLVVGLTVLIMTAGPVWAQTMVRSDLIASSIAIEFPKGSGGWAGPAQSQWGWDPDFRKPDAERMAQYSSGAAVVLVYMNVYLSQEQGRELIYLSNNINGAWRTSPAGDNLPDEIDLGDGLLFAQGTATNYVGDWLIWYRYQNGNRFDADEATAKTSQALETLTGRPEAGVIALATPCRQACETEGVILQDFVIQVGRSIDLNIVKEKQ